MDVSQDVSSKHLLETQVFNRAQVLVWIESNIHHHHMMFIEGDQEAKPYRLLYLACLRISLYQCREMMNEINFGVSLDTTPTSDFDLDAPDVRSESPTPSDTMFEEADAIIKPFKLLIDFPEAAGIGELSEEDKEIMELGGFTTLEEFKASLSKIDSFGVEPDASTSSATEKYARNAYDEDGFLSENEEMLQDIPSENPNDHVNLEFSGEPLISPVEAEEEGEILRGSRYSLPPQSEYEPEPLDPDDERYQDTSLRKWQVDGLFLVKMAGEKLRPEFAEARRFRQVFFQEGIEADNKPDEGAFAGPRKRSPSFLRQEI